jgi:methanogenic corrinoid protein MtbC1
MTNDDSSSGAAAYACGEVFVDTGERSATFARALRLRGVPQQPPRIATLVTTIEAEIVPRLMLARRAGADARPASRVDALDPSELNELTRLLTHHDVGVAKAYVERIRARGVPLDSLCLGLLAPAARRLGEMWEDDTCDFATVTVGLCHLHEVLRQLARAGRVEQNERGPANSVLLVPVPGEQHTFGLLMVAEFFRRNGWSVATEYPATTGDLLELVARDRYSLVGMTVGCREQLDGLSSRITQLRRASRSRSIGVMLGGRPFTEQPELASRLGADATAADARTAATQAAGIVRLLG